MKDVESWERAYIRKYVLAFGLSGIAGMIATGLILWLWPGDRQIGSGLLFIPWMVGGILLIPIAFHKGAELQRQRQAE